jgi:hypothetical protein
MKIIKFIYEFLKATEVKDFTCYSYLVFLNGAHEIFSFLISLISFPFIIIWNILKPSNELISNKEIKFKEKPIYFILFYFKVMALRLASPLGGSSIEDSADLIDFKYTRWCVFIYLVMASTYWFYEIGIPNFESPKKDFAQLMSHDALVKLTVVFGATMGIIALLHRSIVSDYQIKQQNKTEILSNYYKISEHINTHAHKIIIQENDDELKPGSNFPYGLMGSLFSDAKNGIHTISPEIISLLKKVSSKFKPYNEFTAARRAEKAIRSLENIGNEKNKDTVIENIFDKIDNSESLSTQVFLILHLIYQRQMNENLAIYFNSEDSKQKLFILENMDRLNPTYLNSLNNQLSSILEVEDKTKYSSNSNINFKNEFGHIMNLTSKLLAKISSLRNILSSLPLNKNDTNDFYKFERITSDNILYEQQYILEIYESIVYSCKRPSFSGSYLGGGFLVYIYACDKLKIKVNLSKTTIDNLFYRLDLKFSEFNSESENGLRKLRVILDKIEPISRDNK